MYLILITTLLTIKEMDKLFWLFLQIMEALPLCSQERMLIT